MLYIASKQHFGYISQETFPLPTLGHLLRQCSKEVHNQWGVLIIRGFQPKQYTPEEMMVLHAGVTSYIANKRGVQDGNLANEKNVACEFFSNQGLMRVGLIMSGQCISSTWRRI